MVKSWCCDMTHDKAAGGSEVLEIMPSGLRMRQSRKDQESKKKIRSKQAASIQVRFENPKCGQQ